jgi:hypothetical protein
VVEGMDVVDAIAALEVPGTETPREEVVVTDAFVVTE